MTPSFDRAYVDRLFADKNFDDIYWVIGVVGQGRQLPEEFWLFARVYEWAPARGGVWQYYEGLPDEQFRRVADGLDRFGLSEIAQWYRRGRRTWDGPTRAADLDRWLDENAEAIHNAAFALIAGKREALSIKGD